MFAKMNLDNITLEWFRNTLVSNPYKLFEFFDQLYEPRFSIGQIGITAQELQNWKKYKLIEPVSSLSGQRTWNKVSFFEYCWLQLVKILREQSLSFDDILIIRRELFAKPDELLMGDVIKGIKNLKMEAKTPEAKAVLEMVKSQLEDTTAAMKEFEKEMNLFVFVIIGLILENPTEAILIIKGRNSIFEDNGKKRKARNIYMSVYYKKPGEDNDWVRSLLPLFQEYFTSVNLMAILNEFYESKKISASDHSSIFMLSEKERKVYELMRKEGIKELKLRFGDKGKGLILIEVKETKSLNQIHNKVTRLLGGEKFKDVTIKIENNNVVLYEETTKIKP